MRRARARPLLALAALALACSQEGSSEDPVVAYVDGRPILRSEVEARAPLRIHRARVGLHAALSQELDGLIDERLLARAARERGVEPEALLREAEGAAAPVSESDVDAYLARRPGERDPAARPRARLYLEETRRIERRLALAAELREAARLEILLPPPVLARTSLDLEGAPVRGPAGAPVTIVYFADLRSAESARLARELASLERELPGRLRVALRQLPVERDELGLRTAQLAATAQARGRFWELHDRILAANGVARESELEALAAALDLAFLLPELAEDRASLLRVKRDLDHARRAGVRRAPTLFVNGRYFMGLYGGEALRGLVEEELAAAGGQARLP